MLKPIRCALLAMILAGATGVAAAAADDPPAVKAAPDAAKEALRKTIAAAAKEGDISYWDAVIQPTTNNALAAGFRKHYGLPESFKVSYSLSATGALVTRVDQELSAGRVTIDVVGIASLPWVHEKVRAGHVMQYASPQYPAYQAAFDKGLGLDGYFAFNGAYVFVPMWSTERLQFKGDSYKDVLGAVPAGRITIGDATKSVTYLATYMAHRELLGIDFFKKLAEMKPVLVLRSELIANQLITGQYQLAWSGMPTRAYQFNQKGGKLKFVLPKEGVVLLPQAQFITAKAPHPNAAKLWVDYVLSDEGQRIIVNGEAMISGRSGFKSPLPEYAPPIDSLNVVKMDWAKISTADMNKAREEWVSLFNP
ncbi:MAG: extracellular solute-binding protein [Burkholderiales bacterium]|nr:extracellular solute-binding protein [Burkholderiales bacterium]